jgi:hypothetical protein
MPARSASLYQNAEFEMRFRDFPIVRAVCLGRAALLDHFARSAFVKIEQPMLRAVLVLRGSLKTE